MARSLTSAMEGATLADLVRPVLAFELDFAAGFLRANSTPYALTISGNLFLGVGQLGALVPVEETSELGAYQMAMKLRGVPRDMVAIALSQRYQGRTARIWFGALDANHAIIASPVLIFAGRMDNMKVDMGATAEVTVTVENRLADWDRPRVRRYTDEDQQAVWPGDRFFEYVPKLQDATLKWGQT